MKFMKIWWTMKNDYLSYNGMFVGLWDGYFFTTTKIKNPFLSKSVTIGVE